MTPCPTPPNVSWCRPVGHRLLLPAGIRLQLYPDRLRAVSGIGDRKATERPRFLLRAREDCGGDPQPWSHGIAGFCKRRSISARKIAPRRPSLTRRSAAKVVPAWSLLQTPQGGTVPWRKSPRSGWIWPSRFCKCTAQTGLGCRYSTASSGGLRCCGSFRNCRPASWGWRPAPVRTIGRGKSRHVARKSRGRSQ